MIKASSLIREDREYSAAAEAVMRACLSEERLPIAVNGLSGGAELAFVAECATDILGMGRGPVLVLVGNDDAGARTASYLSSVGLRAHLFPSRDYVFHNISASRDDQRERLSVLSAIISGRADVIVATPAAAVSYTMPRRVLEGLSLSLSAGDTTSPEELTDKLSSMGYVRCESVEGRGQFARRGGIVDFFSADSEAPIRVEFFGDEVDRMAYFDPLSQRAVGPSEGIELLPASEVIADAEARGRILAHIETLLTKPSLTAPAAAKLRCEAETVRGGLGIDFRDKYIRLVYEEPETLLSYLSGSAVMLLGTESCRASAEGFIKRMEEEAAALVTEGLAGEGIARYTLHKRGYENFISDNICLHINPFAGGVTGRLFGLFGFRTRRCVSYGNSPSMLYEDLRGLSRSLYRTVILCPTAAGVRSLTDALMGEGIGAIASPDGDTPLSELSPGGILVTVGSGEGFDLITPKIAVLSMEADEGKRIMASRRGRRILRRVGGAGRQIMSHAELSVGDYVVHANYGIGLFEGISQVTTDGVTRDYITIRYAGTDKLFVPCDRIEVIGKYIGARDKDGGVKLSRMGGAEWGRAKARAKSAAKDIAKNLISLYAERQRTPGYAFPADPEMEREFDSAFEYEETDSQLTAISEIREDMARPVPMNRLLLGDVGFGKTEVAIRAAFRAILGNKQVAILVPTTILALQHFGTASSRLRGYPVTVEMLSGFRTPKERERILRRVARGEVDILIGTHSLLSKKLEFRDLGLLIIDEEQRFGVVQKERLREMAKSVDTLTLSATPIPRTLNMAMSGISDISVLDEAPGERRPVQTYVLEHDEAVVRDAISRELVRGGQVLYLYNKVEDIDIVAGRIMNAHPAARVAYAHGKMDKDELEDIWTGLVKGEIDVLVCTTIIETGVDLPGANTLIIENADRFGLSQLHQIRGRVGRSERQAYAYFTYRPGKALSEEAEKRLSAIRDYAEFGAGFKIALRDLEIRGAGNILGAEQHGHIDSVGYDLYVKLLGEAILEEKGEVKEEREEAKVILNLSAHIPDRYISSSASRMDMYKKISCIRSSLDLNDVLDELIDRFGEPPAVVMRLLRVALIKALATDSGIRKVEMSDGRISFVSEKPNLAAWSEQFARYPALSFMGVGSPVVVYRLRRDEDPTEVCASILEGYLSELVSETPKNL